jgi:ABC-type transport system substrate-binding protein
MISLLHSTQRFFALLFILSIAVACKQPETIVVDRNPDTTADDTVEQTVPDQQDASFRQLNIGELQPIHSLDPLLASTTPEMHAIQLMYEGLVRFNASGNIVPAVASEWSASNNNQKYTFHLRSDIFFHDSDVFGSGTGRKLTASDVKFVFKRMARPGVLDRAAQLFSNILGFDTYFREQRYVYHSSLRQLNDIAGITAPNDTTVVFSLDESDPDFLQKLATPLAVIYPKEAVNGQANFEAVGTGPFSFSQQANDSTFIFAKFQDYYAASDVELNRIDLITSDSESALWKAMEAGDIHYLPEVGPTLSQQLVTENNELESSYSDRYRLTSSKATTDLTLRRYSNANISQNLGGDIAQRAQTSLDSLFTNLSSVISNQSFATDNSNVASIPNVQISATAPEAPFERFVLQRLGHTLEEQEVQLSISNLRIPTKEAGLFFTRSVPLIPALEWQSQPAILSFTLRPYTLIHHSVEGISTNQYPWWINLRDTEIPALENIN